MLVELYKAIYLIIIVSRAILFLELTVLCMNALLMLIKRSLFFKCMVIGKIYMLCVNILFVNINVK